MGFIGGVLRSTSGSNNPKVVRQTKNKAIQTQIDQALTDYSGLRTAGESGLADYTAQRLALRPEYETAAGQDRGAIGQFYTGEMASKLADLRAKRQAAVTGAADVAAQQALRSVDQSRIANQGGESSYDKRLAIGALTPIRTQAALDAVNQERSDLGYLTGNQVALAGQREGSIDASSRYGLAPYEAERAIAGGNLGVLGGITNLDQANKFYGLKKPTNKWADFADSADAGILNAAAIYGSVGGGAGGMRRGGLIRIGYDDGGSVHGPGTATSDSIPIHVSDGEFVVQASAVRKPGVLALLHHINSMGDEGDGRTRGKRFGGGGLAGSAQQLNARAMEDLTPRWMPPTMVGEPGGGGFEGEFTGKDGGAGGGSAGDYMKWAKMFRQQKQQIPQEQQDAIRREMEGGTDYLRQGQYGQPLDYEQAAYGPSTDAGSFGSGGPDMGGGGADFGGEMALRRGGLVRIYRR